MMEVLQSQELLKTPEYCHAHESASSDATTVYCPGRMDDGEGEGEGVVLTDKTNEKQKARRRVIAQRHRWRKKEQIVLLRKRSRELESEQALLQTRVVELRGEIEALRYGTEVDMAKENELLRMEIKRHKSFMDQVLNEALHKAPREHSPEERYRVVCSRLQATIHKILGQAYSSAADPSWTVAPSASVQGRCSHTKLSHQSLPHGVPQNEATSLNFRLEEVWDVPLAFFTDRAAQQARRETRGRAAGSLVDVTPDSFLQVATALGDEETIRLLLQQPQQDGEGPRAAGCEASLFAEIWSTRNVSLYAMFPDLCKAFGVPAGLASQAVIMCRTSFPSDAAAREAARLAIDMPGPDGQHRKANSLVLHATIACSNPANPQQSFMLTLTTTALLPIPAHNSGPRSPPLAGGGGQSPRHQLARQAMTDQAKALAAEMDAWRASLGVPL